MALPDRMRRGLRGHLDDPTRHFRAARVRIKLPDENRRQAARPTAKGKQWCSVTRQWVPRLFASNVYQNRARLAAAQAASLCGGAAAPWMASAKDVELAAQRAHAADGRAREGLPQPFELRHAGAFRSRSRRSRRSRQRRRRRRRVHEAAATSLRALAMSLATTSRAIARSDGQSLLSNLPRAARAPRATADFRALPTLQRSPRASLRPTRHASSQPLPLRPTRQASPITYRTPQLSPHLPT